MIITQKFWRKFDHWFYLWIRGFAFLFCMIFFFFFEKDTDSVVILLKKYDFFDPSFYNTPVLKEATFLRVFQSSSVKTQLWGWEEAGKTMKC